MCQDTCDNVPSPEKKRLYTHGNPVSFVLHFFFIVTPFSRFPALCTYTPGHAIAMPRHRPTVCPPCSFFVVVQTDKRFQPRRPPMLLQLRLPRPTSLPHLGLLPRLPCPKLPRPKLPHPKLPHPKLLRHLNLLRRQRLLRRRCPATTTKCPRPRLHLTVTARTSR